jgi:hypothetical protein
MEFEHTLGTLQVDPRDIMVSFDVVSLFTRVSIKNTMDLLGRHFEENILRLFHHVLTTSCFSFIGQFYEQIDGVAMESVNLLVTLTILPENVLQEHSST